MKHWQAKGPPLDLDEAFADVKETWSCHAFCTVCGEQFTEELTMINFSRIMESSVCSKCKKKGE